MPTRLAAGQEGAVVSAAPVLAAAAAIAASGQYGIPASLPTRPGGSPVSTEASLWEPSSRLSLSTKGL